MKIILAMMSVVARGYLMQKTNRILNKFCLIIMPIFLAATSVQATNYTNDSFEYFAKTDVNSAFIELHIQEKKKLVLINGEVITPIEYSGGKSFNLTGTNTYSTQLGGYDSFQAWDGQAYLASAVNTTSDINVFIGDFNGDGHKDQLLQSKKGSAGNALTDQTLIIIYGSNTVLPSGVETVSEFLTSQETSSGHLNGAEAKINVGDFNSDGITDIEITYIYSEHTDIYKQAIAYGASQGMGEITWAHGGRHVSSVTSNVVGLITSGKANVSPTGAATYGLSIDVPSSLSGLQPSVSIQYSSQARATPTPLKLSDINPSTGPLGLGWSIGGLSAISRCQTDLTRETKVDAVDFDSNDQYCLDGQRLILQSGSHGTDGAVYHTELSANAKVISVGSAGNGPQSFKVINANGEITEYGNTLDSRQEAFNRSEIYRWNISLIKNSVGSEIDFTYQKDVVNLIYHIDEIAFQNTVISFDYDVSTNKHVPGTLKNISVSQNSTEVSKYKFIYTTEALHGRKKLTNIQKCRLLACMAPLDLSWSTDKALLFTANSSGPTTGVNDSSLQAASVDLSRVRTGDFNGDGLTDIYYIDGWGNSAQDKVWLSNGDGTFEDMGSVGPATGVNGSSLEAASVDMSRLKFADFNGDGKTDVYYIDGWGNSAKDKVWLSNGNGTFEDKGSVGPATGVNDSSLQAAAVDISRLKFSDINGDGMADVYYIDGWGNSAKDRVWLSNGNGTFEDMGSVGPATGVNGSSLEAASVDMSRLRFADFNGDGMSDVYFVDGWGNSATDKVWLSNGDGTFEDMGSVGPATGVNDSSLAAANVDISRIRTGDFNGDGLSDIYYIDGWGNSAQDKVWLSNGDGTFEDMGSVGPATGVNDSSLQAAAVDISRLKFADLNGDGMTDIYFVDGWGNSAKDKIWLSNGDGTFSYEGSVGPATGVNDSSLEAANVDISRILLGNFTKNGIADVYYIDGWGNSPADTVYVNTYEVPKIQKVTNGLGKESIYTYEKAVKNPAVYTLGEASSDETIVSMYPGSLLVSKLETKSSLLTTSTSYQYEGMKSHRLGMGSLGFSKLTVTDNQTSIKTITEFEQKPNERLIGFAKSSKTVTPTNVELSSSTSVWESQGTNGSSFKVRLRKSFSQKKALNGTNTYKNETYYCVTDAVNCTALATSYDAYGNPKIIKATITDQQNGGETFNTQTNNEFWPLNTFATNSTDFYYTSQMKKVTVGKSGSKRAPKTRVAEFNSYYPNGKLKKETIEPFDVTIEGAVDEALVTEYEYETNGYGRITKKTVSGTGIATRSSSVAYDASNPYLSTATNALDHTRTTELSPLWGKTVKATGKNDITTRFAYDDFGRLQINASPDGGLMTVDYKNCDSSCPANAVFYKQSTGSDGISSTVSKTYVDALRRTVATSSQGFDGREIRVDYLYDAKGRQYKTSLPYFVSGSETKKYKENTVYDILNRVTEVTHPNASKSTVVYNGLSTTFYNAANQKKVTIKNALGETITSTDDDLKVLTLEYDALGNLVKTTDEANNPVVMNYDIRGNKTSMTDPDKGHWKYEYNVLGQLVLQTDAKSQSTCMTYDKLGRMSQRIDNYMGISETYTVKHTNALNSCAGDSLNTQTANWQYDTSPVKGIGKLHSISNATGYSEVMSYDTLGRVTNKAITIDGKTHNIGQTYYSNTSKVDNMMYPSYNGAAFTTKSRYNANGFLYQTQDAITQTAYWTATAYNARGQLTHSTLGNGVTTEHEFNADTGMMDYIRTLKDGAGIQALDYNYDAVGNLEYRADELQLNLTETFGYDDLNRLTSSAITSVSYNENQATTYDLNGLGNILTKTDVGTYEYGKPNASCAVNFAGPHAVTSITGGNLQAATNYCYDANGNMVSGAGREISYTVFGKPSLLIKGTSNVQFKYGPSRNRVQRIDNNATTTTYVGGIYEEINASNLLTGKYYIGNYAVVTKEATDQITRYMHQDHLGSVDAITNEAGTVVERTSFDAWGKRRNTQQWNNTFDLFNFNSEITKRGYTNHEQIDSMGLIHMNGRVYDPILARFISADPIIQAPVDMQSYNRYAYVRNNPLAYTDPSGYSWLSNEIDRIAADIRYETDHFYNSVWKKHGDVIYAGVAAAAVCYFTGPVGCNAYVAGAAGAATAATLKTPSGQRAVRKFSGVLEKLGVDEEHSQFLSSMILSYGLNAAYSSGFQYVSDVSATKPPLEEFVGPQPYGANGPEKPNALNSPVGDATVTSEFGANRTCNPCSTTHGGTDYGVSIGTDVQVTADGTVARAYNSTSYGRTVIVNHGPAAVGEGNVYTLYAHGDSLLVNQGQTVTMGQQVMQSGNTGFSTGPHLHYEVIQTTSTPFQGGFFGNLNERYAPSALDTLLP